MKTVAKTSVCGTAPNASASVFTSPDAIGVVVPGCTAVPAVTEKWLASSSTLSDAPAETGVAVNAAELRCT